MKVLTKSPIFLTFSLVLATVSGGTGLDSNESRDLRLYERAGPYVLAAKANPITEDSFLIAASIRDFLWRHWRGHRLGTLLVTTFSIEGLPTRTTYFVEPDKSGVWRVLSETSYTLLSTEPGTTKHSEQLETSVAYSVERMEALPDGTTSNKAIAVTEIRDPLSYHLVLKDQQGNVIAQL